MFRKAIIIGNNTGKDAPTYLEGVNKDLLNYHAYLKSDVGGLWYDHEITILHNKMKEEITRVIAACSGDYSFVVFSGHGFINSQNGLTYICVNGDYVCETELNTYLNKRTLILDCCREVTSVNESFTGRTFTAKLEKSDKISGIATQVYHPREKFDISLAASGNGQFTGYACLVGQTSGDNPSAGGVFSSTLMRVGMDFGSKIQPHFTLEIKDAVIRTKQVLDSQSDPFNKLQSPEWKTTSGLYTTAPFAVANWRNPQTGLLW